MDVKTQSLEDNLKVEEATQESWGSFFLFLAKLLIAVLIFRIFLFSPFSIPSESMLPRLMNGDYLLASKWSYGFSKHSLPVKLPLPDGRLFAGQPERGDVVLFKHPIDEQDYIKRVIGLPGDTVSLVDGQLVLNGTPIAKEAISEFEVPASPNTTCAWGAEEIARDDGQPVCLYRRFRETMPSGRDYDVLDFGLTNGDTFGPTIIPEGHMFVMGDNRDNSRDSRFEARANDAVGIVDQDLLVGEASIIMWSTDGSAEWLKPWTWFTAARWDRIGNTL